MKYQPGDRVWIWNDRMKPHGPALVTITNVTNYYIHVDIPIVGGYHNTLISPIRVHRTMRSLVKQEKRRYQGMLDRRVKVIKKALEDRRYFKGILRKLEGYSEAH